MKTVVLDAYSVNPGDLSWEKLASSGELVLYDRTRPEEVLERVKDADAVLTNKVVLNEDILSKMERTRYIGVLATGYNVVDVEAAGKYGKTVTNIPAYSTDSVAQMVFAHLLAITNHVEWFTERNREGRWSSSPDFCYWEEPLIELAGHTMGIVGLGNIGMKVARIAHDFGMKVRAFSSKKRNELPEWIDSVTLEELFRSSDVLTLHCPLTGTTRNLVNAERIATMKDGAVVINTGRGPLLDEQAVAEALHSGKLAAVGVDVLSSEPPAADCPLLSAPRCYVTPHVAWATVEARKRLIDIAAANLHAWAVGNPQNVVG